MPHDIIFALIIPVCADVPVIFLCMYGSTHVEISDKGED